MLRLFSCCCPCIPHKKELSEKVFNSAPFLCIAEMLNYRELAIISLVNRHFFFLVYGYQQRLSRLDRSFMDLTVISISMVHEQKMPYSFISHFSMEKIEPFFRKKKKRAPLEHCISETVQKKLDQVAPQRIERSFFNAITPLKARYVTELNIVERPTNRGIVYNSELMDQFFSSFPNLRSLTYDGKSISPDDRPFNVPQRNFQLTKLEHLYLNNIQVSHITGINRLLKGAKQLKTLELWPYQLTEQANFSSLFERVKLPNLETLALSVHIWKIERSCEQCFAFFQSFTESIKKIELTTDSSFSAFLRQFCFPNLKIIKLWELEGSITPFLLQQNSAAAIVFKPNSENEPDLARFSPPDNLQALRLHVPEQKPASANLLLNAPSLEKLTFYDGSSFTLDLQKNALSSLTELTISPTSLDTSGYCSSFIRKLLEKACNLKFCTIPIRESDKDNEKLIDLILVSSSAQNRSIHIGWQKAADGNSKQNRYSSSFTLQEYRRCETVESITLDWAARKIAAKIIIKTPLLKTLHLREYQGRRLPYAYLSNLTHLTIENSPHIKTGLLIDFLKGTPNLRSLTVRNCRGIDPDIFSLSLPILVRSHSNWADTQITITDN
jgi:hypothetical protein